jgi:adenine/guanine phosphoribosyltransferase-like PRPP-binding protein
VGCSNFSNNNSNNLVARAGENFLYENDLPEYTSRDDSLIKISSFIEAWAKEKVLYDLSMINLSQSKRSEIDELVENYKVDLYINSYKDLIVNSKIDSIVTTEQIDSFYTLNINNFKLNENLVKYRYVKVPNDNININRIRRYIVRVNEQDRYFLDSLNFQFADLKLNDSIWFTERDVISSIDFINQNNKSKYFIKNRLFTIEESNYTNFFIVDDILRSGNIPPISYLYERIKSTIVNQRKLNLLKNLNKEILNDALKSRKYEVYK